MRENILGSIAFDADDTLIKNIVKFNAFHNHKYGTSYTVEDYVSFDLTKIWGISQYEIWDNEREFYESNFYKEIERNDHSLEVVEYLCQKYNLPIITGRGKDVEHHLFSTLSTLFEPHHFSSVHHVGAIWGTPRTGIQKWQKCKEEDASLLIDDYHVHLIRAAQQGIHGILMEAPWNKHITDLPSIVYRVRNLNEAVEVIEKKEKIIFK